MFDGVWRAFADSDTTLGPTPGAREAWRRGRSRYAVWALRVDDARAIERMTRVAEAVAAFADSEPVERAHVTLFVCGFPASEPALDDDVDVGVLAAQSAALADAGEVELVLGGANCFGTCAFVEVADPTGQLGRWRAGLAGAYPPGHRGEIRFAPYVPHVTAATFDAAHPTAAIADALAPLRVLPPIEIRCSAPILVDFDATRPTAPLRRLVVV